MTVEDIKSAPNGTYFAFINIEGGSMKQGEYVVEIIRKTGFRAPDVTKGMDILEYEAARVHVQHNAAHVRHVKPAPGGFSEGNLPVTEESAKKYFSQDPKNFEKVKRMIVKAPFETDRVDF